MSEKVVCAISHGLYEPWLSILRDGQEKTWLKTLRPEGFDVVHFHATPLSSFSKRVDAMHERIRFSKKWKRRMLKKLDLLITSPWMNYQAKYSSSSLLSTQDFALHIHFPGSYLTYRWKELALFHYFLNQTEADYLFITTSSSYIRPGKLMDYIATLPKAGVYAGGLPYKNAKFVSGSNRILSSDVVALVLENASNFSTTVLEDVALGSLINDLGVDRIFIPLINLASLGELNCTSDNVLTENYHFRLTSGPLGKRGDVEIMIELHKRAHRLDFVNE
jgi:hypothetical protein